jgi:very-short-patch-repair endonuclease
MIKYSMLTDEQKHKQIRQLYEVENKSFKDIADMLDTYPNKVRRDAIKYNIKIRDKSEAQKNALTTGKHKHPTKGTTRSAQTKQKIGQAVLESWDNLSDSELESRKQKARENWNNLSDVEKQNIQHKAITAVRKSSKEGSKLEKFILSRLISDGYKTIFHQEQTLVNTKLQIDIAIPSINVAIEIDGPSHFAPVWGEKTLDRNKRYDKKKEGLIIGKGLTLIRIKQTKDFSNARAEIIYSELKTVLEQIANNAITDKKIEIQD